jgi:hypothetical protein
MRHPDIESRPEVEGSWHAVGSDTSDERHELPGESLADRVQRFANQPYQARRAGCLSRERLAEYARERDPHVTTVEWDHLGGCEYCGDYITAVREFARLPQIEQPQTTGAARPLMPRSARAETPFVEVPESGAGSVIRAFVSITAGLWAAVFAYRKSTSPRGPKREPA